MNSLSRFQRYALTLAFSTLALSAAFGIAMYGSVVYAAPPAQEIPAASVARNAPTFATLYSGRVTTATGAVTYGPVYDVTPYDKTETQLVVDMGALVAGAPNTVTVGYQYSNDRVNWTDLAVAATITNDQNIWSSQVITGHYLRAKLTPSSAGTLVTTTLSAVLEP